MIYRISTILYRYKYCIENFDRYAALQIIDAETTIKIGMFWTSEKYSFIIE